MIRVKPTELVTVKELPSSRPAALNKAAAEPMPTTVRLSTAARTLAASISQLTHAKLYELLGAQDRTLLGLTAQLISELGLDPAELDKLAHDLRVYRAQSAANEPQQGERQAGLNLSLSRQPQQAPEWASVETPLDAGFVTALFEADANPTVNLELVRQLVTRLTPAQSDLPGRFTALLERHAARVELGAVVTSLSRAWSEPQLTTRALREGFALLQERVAKNPLQDALLTRPDRELLVVLYAVAKTQRLPLVVVDEVVEALGVLRKAEHTVLAQEARRASIPAPASVASLMAPPDVDEPVVEPAPGTPMARDHGELRPASVRPSLAPVARSPVPSTRPESARGEGPASLAEDARGLPAMDPAPRRSLPPPPGPEVAARRSHPPSGPEAARRPSMLPTPYEAPRRLSVPPSAFDMPTDGPLPREAVAQPPTPRDAPPVLQSPYGAEFSAAALADGLVSPSPDGWAAAQRELPRAPQHRELLQPNAAPQPSTQHTARSLGAYRSLSPPAPRQHEWRAVEHALPLQARTAAPLEPQLLPRGVGAALPVELAQALGVAPLLPKARLHAARRPSLRAALRPTQGKEDTRVDHADPAEDDGAEQARAQRRRERWRLLLNRRRKRTR